MPRISLEDARSALVAAGITGSHRSHSRRSSIGKIADIFEGDTHATFGLSGLDRFTPEQILGFVARVAGCSADISDLEIEDEIDPERTMDALVVMGKRLAAEARRGTSVFLATGHPTGLLEFYIRVADAYSRAGGKILRLREGERAMPGGKGRRHEVRYVGGVGCLSDWGNLRHTHGPESMEVLLQGDTWPEMVVADHGFAGAAIERGIPTIAVMDINDHALAAAWGRGADVVVLPMDDNRPPRLYEPAWQVVEDLLEET